MGSDCPNGLQAAAERTGDQVTRAERDRQIDELQGQRNELEFKIGDSEKQLSKAEDVVSDLECIIDSLQTDLEVINEQLNELEDADIDEEPTE